MNEYINNTQKQLEYLEKHGYKIERERNKYTLLKNGRFVSVTCGWSNPIDYDEAVRGFFNYAAELNNDMDIVF